MGPTKQDLVDVRPTAKNRTSAFDVFKTGKILTPQKDVFFQRLQKSLLLLEIGFLCFFGVLVKNGCKTVRAPI
jgi:hypothetical protein